MRIRNGFKETFFVALSNDDIIIGMDFRGQVLKWMLKIEFFWSEKKKNRAPHPHKRIAKSTSVSELKNVVFAILL